MQIIDKTISKNDFSFLREDISFGGGTALMVQINHRESYDIDLFLNDAQLLNYLNPISQDYNLFLTPSSYVLDSKYLKINFNLKEEGIDKSGEIDFICAGHITKNPTYKKVIEGYDVKIEHPYEIVAKKIVYRGREMPSRDIFDIACVIEKYGEEYLINELSDLREECNNALKHINKITDNAHRDTIAGLIVKDEYEHVKYNFTEITKSFFEKVISSGETVPNIKQKIFNYIKIYFLRVVRGL